MKKHLFFLFLFSAVSTMISFSQEVFLGKTINLKEESKNLLNKNLTKYDSYILDLPSLNSKISNEKKQSTISLHLGEKKIKLTILPKEIRSVNYISSENGIENKIQQTQCVTYVGYADNDEKNELRLMITDRKIRGFIKHNGELLFISQLSYFGISDTTKKFVVTYRIQDVVDKGGFCGVSELQEQKFLLEKVKANNTQGNIVGCENKLELATDADYEFYQRYGAGANDEILGIINMVEGLYVSTFNMNISVVHQNVWTSPGDPYTGNPSTDSGSELLVNELRGYWENGMQSIQRDLVHLFTGRDYNQEGVVGRVYEIGSVCKARDKSYGFTKDRISQFLTTAHEIGHNLGGVHEDGVNCGTYGASIMCQGPKSIPMYFSNASIGRISSFLNANSNCIKEQYTISGPASICNEATYSIPNLPAGATVSWSATGSVNISGSNNANLVTVTKNSNGVGILTANVLTACGDFSVSKQVDVGVLNAVNEISINGYPYSSSGTLCLSRRSKYRIEVSPMLGATSYYWSVIPSSSATIGYGQGEDAIWITVNGSIGAPVSINLRVENACGLGGEFSVSGKVCGFGEGMMDYAISPNPSDNELKITSENGQNISLVNERLTKQIYFSVKLLNQQGKILKEDKNKAGNKEIILQVADIPNGIYYLHIYEGKKVSKQQVIISH